MKRGIKITLIIIAVLFTLVIGAAFAIPYFFKDQIQAAVIKAANESLNAKLNFTDVSLSVFRDFPDVSVRLQNLTVTNMEPFEDIRLADVEAADVTVDIMSIIRNQKPWRIKSIYVKKPNINVFVLEDGRANYDIVKPTADSLAEEPETATSDFNITLESYEIEDGNIVYKDETIGIDLSIKGLDHKGSGDFTSMVYDLNTDTNVDSLSLTYGGIPYLKRAHTELDAIFNIDQANSKYTLKDNIVKLNDLELRADGFVQLPDTSNIVMDLKFSTPQSEFKDLLSMIPNAYIAGYESVKADGTFNLSGFAKGTYNATQETYPAFQVNLGVENGSIKYPDLPLGISNINTKINVNSPTSNFDDLLLDIPTFAMQLGSNPIRAVFKLKTPISDPDVDTQIDGTLNLKELSQAFPMEGMSDLSGIISADVDVKTRLSYIENQEYEKVNMRGDMSVQGLNYKDVAYPAIRINSAKAQFTPQNVRLENFDAKLGKSDVKASGSIQNILAYFSPKKTMRGQFTVRSNSFDANEWVPKETATTTQPALPASQTQPAAATEIFDRFDFTLDAAVGQLAYDTYRLKNSIVKGNIKPNKLSVSELSTQIGESDVKASGVITNLFDYLFDNQTLGGNIAVSSKVMNLNQFMTADGSAPQPTATTTSTASTAGMEPILIPKNIDMTIRANMDKVIYTNMILDNVKGDLIVAKEAVVLQDVTANILGGKVALSGGYDTKDKANPGFNLKYDLQNMDFQKTFGAFNSFQVLAPIGAFIRGNFNTSLILDGTLGKNVMPNFNSLNMQGFLETINGIIDNFRPLQVIGEKFNIDYFKEALTIKNTKNWFELKDGAVAVKEFDYQYKDIPMKIAGTHGLNQDINYTIKAKIPRKLIEKMGVGAAATKGLDQISKEAAKFGLNIAKTEFVNVQFNLTGSIKSPKVGFKLLGTDGGESSPVASATEQVKDAVKNEVKEKITEGKEQLKQTATKAVDSVKTVLKDKTEQAKEDVTKKAEEAIKDKLGSKVDSTTKEEIKNQLDKFNPFKKKKKEEPKKDSTSTSGN